MGYEYYDYGTSYDASNALTTGLGVLGGLFAFLGIILLIVLAISIVQLIATWKVYKKAGKGGWECIIPFYCNWVLVEIAGLNWWWFLLFFAPLVTTFIGLGWLGYLAYVLAAFNCYYNISKRFNKGVGFAICLTLFTPICFMILGFSKKNVYDANVVVSNNGVIPGDNVPNNNGVNTNNQNNVAPQPMYNNPQPVQGNSCSKCGSTVNPGDRFCMNCGTPIEQQTVQNIQPVQHNTCSKCGSIVNSGDRFCMNCGNQL